MRLAVLICVLGLAVQLVGAEGKGVSWVLIDPFCGQVKSSESETFPVKKATIKLYRAKAKYLPCCGSAERLEDVRLDASGNFDLRKRSPDQYWMVAVWDKTEVPVALWVDGKSHFACSDQYKNVIEIRPSTKTAERTISTSVNSLTHAQTH